MSRRSNVRVLAEERIAARRASQLFVPDGPRGRGGGAGGNSRLTALTACVLLVLLAVEGLTLLSLHVCVGMLLVPVVALKAASTGWRFLGYYTGRREYVQAGPPAPLMRFLVAPVLLAATAGLFGTGVALIVFGPRHPVFVGLHKASFVVWLGATTIHVLAYVLRLPRLVGTDLGRRDRLPGAGLRQLLLAASVIGGATLGVWALPYAHQWHAWMFG